MFDVSVTIAIFSLSSEFLPNFKCTFLVLNFTIFSYIFYIYFSFILTCKSNLYNKCHIKYKQRRIQELTIPNLYVVFHFSGRNRHIHVINQVYVFFLRKLFYSFLQISYLSFFGLPFVCFRTPFILWHCVSRSSI